MEQEAGLRQKVLVVEDDPLQADVLARFLVSHDYYVDIAGDGRSALRQICSGMFDVTLVDYGLPEIDGQSLARVTRTLGGSYPLPRLIALTSSMQASETDASDFDEILRKPFVPTSLLAAIARGRLEDGSRETPSGIRTALAPILPDLTPGKSGRLLIADDDALLREFLKLTLQSRGFEVDVANDGLEAIGQINTNAYHVVVIDFRMPQLDGLAAAKIIYDLSHRRTRPRIVALTSAPAELMAQDSAWDLVIDQIVKKSTGIQPILEAIENCMSYKEARSEQPLEVFDLQIMMSLIQSTG